MFGSLGTTELIIILVIVLLIFGAGRLPEVFRAMGKGMKEFRDASGGENAKTASEDAVPNQSSSPK